LHYIYTIRVNAQPKSRLEKMMPHIKLKPDMAYLEQEFEVLLRACVYAQEDGHAVGEMLVNVFGHSGAHAVAVSVHDMRLKMIKEGADIQRPPRGKGFILGFPED
jgi:hypothetical protein